MSNPVVHDFVLLLYVFNKIVENKSAKEITYKNLKWLINERVPRHKEYFAKNEALTSSYQFVKKVFDFFIDNPIDDII